MNFFRFRDLELGRDVWLNIDHVFWVSERAVAPDDNEVTVHGVGQDQAQAFRMNSVDADRLNRVIAP